MNSTSASRFTPFKESHPLRTLALAFLVMAFGWSGTALQAEILSSDRRINWAAGVRGGIPDTGGWTVIDVTAPPFNAAGNGVTDDRAAIQSALDVADSSSVVFFPAGTYRISGTLDVDTDNLLLKGEGPDLSIIKYDGSSGTDVIAFNDIGPRAGGAIDIESGFNKDSTQITISNASSFGVGDLLVISQLNPPGGWVTASGDNGLCGWCGYNDPSRLMSQINKVIGKNGNTLTLERPLYYDYTLAPTVKRLSGTLAGSGVEDLQVWRSNSSARNGTNISFDYCENCWVRNVKSLMAGNNHVKLWRSYACEIRKSNFRDGWDHGGGKSYGIFILVWNADHLIEDNVFWRLRHAISWESGGSGSVVAYNYLYGSLNHDGDFVSPCINTHGGHTHMNLIEGNVTDNIWHDYTWGSASHNTSFRNWIVNDSSETGDPSAGRWGYVAEAANWYNNVIGCIIGQAGDTGKQFTDGQMGWYDMASFCLGPQNPPNDSIDGGVASTILIHGTYDFIGNEVQWDSGIPDRNLPDSLYLSAKPDWFGALNWPPFDPADPLAASADDIPAGYRELNGIDPVPETGPGRLSLSPSSSVSEGAATVTIRVTRSGGSEGAVGVSYSTADGTATSGSDYSGSNGSLTWNDGEAGAKTFTVAILDDNDPEDSETFTVTITNVTGGASQGNSAMTVTIMDDEPPQLPLMPGLNFEAEDGLIVGQFTVSGGLVSQGGDNLTDPSSGGFAGYRFSVSEPGNYVIRMMVEAETTGSDSFFVNIDGEPVNPGMIWDIAPLTSGIEERTVTWRGTGGPGAPQFDPQVWNLTAGEHSLIIRGREARTWLDRITIEPYSAPVGEAPPPPPENLRILP